MTKDEMIEKLLIQVNTLTASLNSLQQAFDAQTVLIAQLNQTIQELREQINKNSRNSSNPRPLTAIRNLPPKVSANLLVKKLVVRLDIREHILLLSLLQIM